MTIASTETLPSQPPKTKQQLKAERRAAFIEGVNYVYGFSTRSGQRRPTVTVAIFPKMVDGNLYFGIGVSRCADCDQPNKATGRARATARAKAVMEMGGKDILSRPDSFAGLSRRVLGMHSHFNELAFYLKNLELTESLTDRVFNSCEYLAKKLGAVITPEA